MRFIDISIPLVIKEIVRTRFGKEAIFTDDDFISTTPILYRNWAYSKIPLDSWHPANQTRALETLHDYDLRYLELFTPMLLKRKIKQVFVGCKDIINSVPIYSKIRCYSYEEDTESWRAIYFGIMNTKEIAKCFYNIYQKIQIIKNDSTGIELKELRITTLLQSLRNAEPDVDTKDNLIETYFVEKRKDNNYFINFIPRNSKNLLIDFTYTL